MKRTALKAKTPLRRRTKLKPRRSTKRRSERKRDTAYMLWVKTLPCCAPDVPPVVGVGCCSGAVEAHHAGRRAAGRKADDDTAIPLCQRHHVDWHAAIGPFDRWSQGRRRAWADARIAETQAAWALRGRNDQPECPF